MATDPARRATPGRVSLVGAGPGDPDLITRRGLAALRACDVVLYDRLVAPELVSEAAGAEAICVGKTPGGPQPSQRDITALMIERARAGCHVVRLKGGDPFVFGRGGEEALALAARGIPFEVVPGVTSATAAAGAAGVPVTHRGIASSVAVVTPRSGPGGRPPRWDLLAHATDTLVLMMGVADLAESTAALVAAGRDPEQPAVLVEWATTPRQRTIAATLGTIATRAHRAGIAPPATVVVGDVAALASVIGAAAGTPAPPLPAGMP